MSSLHESVAQRRTFAIISHPDAGKTTLTEKLLLYGGAIQLAGEVKARGDRRRARSDWMKVEQERGISVNSSVMTYRYAGRTFNLLDTPGHEDFSEDTYRTLSAVDSAVMVIDAAKGIEARTRKLFEICRLRDVPIITFVNKLDREGRDPMALLDEIEATLQLEPVPVSWPIGMGRGFRGCYDLLEDRLMLVQRAAEGGDGAPRRGRATDGVDCEGLDDPRIEELLDAGDAARLREEVEMVRYLCPAFDREHYLTGDMTPVCFGSALNDFGVRYLLDALAELAPPPQPRPAVERLVDPAEDTVSGFVFKIQANMDPRHRDRLAFIRLCSGRFERGMKMHQPRTAKTFAVHNPMLFLARDRARADEAWAGDILGIPNHGNLRIGDALTEGESLRFTGVPSFAPEILRRVRAEDPMRSKHLGKALFQLAEEGVAQILRPAVGTDWIVGVAGALQFEILADRIRTEYNVAVRFEPTDYQVSRWLESDEPQALKDFLAAHGAHVVEDHTGSPVFLARSDWHLKCTRDDWPGVRFLATREQIQ